MFAQPKPATPAPPAVKLTPQQRLTIAVLKALRPGMLDALDKTPAQIDSALATAKTKILALVPTMQAKADEWIAKGLDYIVALIPRVRERTDEWIARKWNALLTILPKLRVVAEDWISQVWARVLAFVPGVIDKALAVVRVKLMDVVGAVRAKLVAL
jgi:hypothetical protein